MHNAPEALKLAQIKAFAAFNRTKNACEQVQMPVGYKGYVKDGHALHSYSLDVQLVTNYAPQSEIVCNTIHVLQFLQSLRHPPFANADMTPFVNAAMTPS